MLPRRSGGPPMELRPLSPGRGILGTSLPRTRCAMDEDGWEAPFLLPSETLLGSACPVLAVMMSENWYSDVRSRLASARGPKPTGRAAASDICLGCEELEAWASLLCDSTGEEGVLKTCFLVVALVLEVAGLSISSILLMGGVPVPDVLVAGPAERCLVSASAQANPYEMRHAHLCRACS